MASVGKSVATNLRNAATTISEMEADKRSFQLCLERFVRAYEDRNGDQIEAAYEDAIIALENRNL